MKNTLLACLYMFAMTLFIMGTALVLYKAVLFVGAAL
jgi:hypothetical protein